MRNNNSNHYCKTHPTIMPDICMGADHNTRLALFAKQRVDQHLSKIMTCMYVYK